MTLVVAALVVVVVLLSVLVAGLLRSHGAILRRLDELGAGLDVDPGVPATVRAAGRTTATGATRPATGGTRTAPRTDGSVPEPPTDVPDGRAAADLVGTAPRGGSVAVRVVDVAHDTLLVFLSSGCGSCAGFWEAIGRTEVPDGTRVVVVTRSPAEESPGAIAELAAPGVHVVMSSDAWDTLGVPGSPYIIQVDGPSGRVVGEGTAASFSQVLALFLRADGDARHAAGGKAAADERRERHLDRILLEAGVAPGDPSLYGPGPEARPGAEVTAGPHGGGQIGPDTEVDR